jgi:hypothetical protein
MADLRINKDPSAEVSGISQAAEASDPAVAQEEECAADESLSQYSDAGKDIAGRICIPCAERIVGNILFSEKASVNLPERERKVPNKAWPAEGKNNFGAASSAAERTRKAGYTLDEFESKKLSVCVKRFKDLDLKKKAAVERLEKAETADEKKAAMRSVMEVRLGLSDLIKEMNADAWERRPYTFSPTFNELFFKARNDLGELKILSNKR